MEQEGNTQESILVHFSLCSPSIGQVEMGSELQGGDGIRTARPLQVQGQPEA